MMPGEHHDIWNDCQFDCLFNSLCSGIWPTEYQSKAMCYWPFVSWIHQWPLDFPQKGSLCGLLGLFVQDFNLRNSQIPQFTHPISHNAPFRTKMCAFLLWIVHCGIWDRCIVGFVSLVYLPWNYIDQYAIIGCHTGGFNSLAPGRS